MKLIGTRADGCDCKDPAAERHFLDWRLPVRNKTTSRMTSEHSVMMAFFWQGAVLLSLAVTVLVHAGNVCSSLSSLPCECLWVGTRRLCVPSLADMDLDCGPDYVTLVWTENRRQTDTSLYRLGNCLPTSVSIREAVFSVTFNDCNFRLLVSTTPTCKLEVNWAPPQTHTHTLALSPIGYWE